MEDLRTADDADEDSFYHEAENPKIARDNVFDHSASRGVKPTLNALTINPRAKQTKRDRLRRQIDAFIAHGGEITKCPPGRPPNFRFGAFKPPAGSVGSSRDNDLSRRRWRGPILEAGKERDLIRAARAGDERAKDELFKSFHRLILKIVSQYSGPPHNDLMAAGTLGFWEVVRRFNLNHNSGRLSTYAQHWIRKHVREAVKDWSKEGAAGETRQDRWLYGHPDATAEELVAAAGGTLADAEKAIARLSGGLEHYDTTGETGYNNDTDHGRRIENDDPAAPNGAGVARGAFGCFSGFQFSPQLRLHEPVSRLIDGLARESESRTKRRIHEIGRRAYALELVKQHKARVEAHAEPTQYLYPSLRAVRNKIDPISEAARRNGIAHKLDQYSWLTYRQSKAQLWAMHSRDPANLRTAGESRRWQKRDWEAESRKEAHVRQIDRRRNAPPDIRSAGVGRRGNGARSPARSHQPQLHLPPGAGQRPAGTRIASREGGLK